MVVCNRGIFRDSETGDAAAAPLPRMARGTAAADNQKAVIQVRASFRAPNASLTFRKPALLATRPSFCAPVSARNGVSRSSQILSQFCFHLHRGFKRHRVQMFVK